MLIYAGALCLYSQGNTLLLPHRKQNKIQEMKNKRVRVRVSLFVTQIFICKILR